MAKGYDLLGQRFGRLLVTKYAYSDAALGRIWECVCDCGNVVEVRGTRLVKGYTKSCGCFAADSARENHTTHGMTRPNGKHHPAYISWANNPKHKSYKDYGGRGVTYDTAWEMFENFWKDMGPTWENGLTIDRIDSSGNYCKENCRWADVKTQNNNKKSVRKYEYSGQLKTLSEWASLYGLSRGTLYDRVVRYGYSIEDALTTPLRGKL